MITIRKKFSDVCNLIILWGLTLLVFLVPLFFLPFNPRLVDFSKQLLLFVIILIIYLAWFGKGIINKKLILRRTPLDIPILSFVIIYILATVFSVDRVTSILGTYGQGALGLISVIFYALLYFVMVSNINTPRKIIQLCLGLFASLGLTILYVFLQLFNIFILPWNFTKINSFNLIGSISSLSVFLAVVLSLAVAFLLKSRIKTVFRILLVVLILADLLLINTVNFLLSWYILILGMFILLGFGIARSKGYLASKWLVVPGALLVISIFAATLGIPPLFKGKLPNEISLARGLSWEISRKTVWSGFFSFLFGSGPETFGYDFSRFRPDRFNQNILWNVRFDRANNTYLELLATTGVLGILGYVVIILIALGSSGLVLIESKKGSFWKVKKESSPQILTRLKIKKPLFHFRTGAEEEQPEATPRDSKKEKKIEIPSEGAREPLGQERGEAIRIPPRKESPQGVINLKSKQAREEEEEEEEIIKFEAKPRVDFLTLGLVAAWVSLLLAEFLNITNTTLEILFWVLIALVMSLATIQRPEEFKKTKISFRASPKYALLLSFTFVVALSAVTVLFTYLGRIHLADAYHQKGLEKNTEQKYDEATLFFSRAIGLNKHRPIYYLALAQNCLAQANLEAAKGAEANLDQIRLLIANSINESKNATDRAPRDVNFWEARGQIYENTTLYSNDANEWVIKSYQKAQELEPTNPIFATKLGRAYMANAALSEGETQDENYNKAEEALKKAIELKPDYLVAHYFLALVYEKKEQLAQALEEIGICYQIAPRNPDIIFELGRLSYNKAIVDSPTNLKNNPDFQRALNAFQLVVSLNTNHANAHYSLGLAYETLGENQKALDEMKIVQNLNPNNEQVVKKIESLEAKVAGASTE